MVTRRRFVLGGALLLVEKTGSGADRVDGVSSPASIKLNINNGSWVGGWDQPGTNGSQRVNMEYANCFQLPSGKQIEFCMAQHHRSAGDNTGVRLAEPQATGAPKMSYLWPNNDTLIWETDNMSAFYLPWKQWCFLQGHKIIDIGTPQAILRWPSTMQCQSDASGDIQLDMTGVVEVIKQNPGWADGYWRAVYNATSDVNPPADAKFTFNLGGGYWSGGMTRGAPSLVRVIDDNPNYPATSTKPLRLRIFSYKGESPLGNCRHGVRVGDYFYWGGQNTMNDGAGNRITSVGAVDGLKKFYRVKVADLANGVVTQEVLPDLPLQGVAAFGGDVAAGGWRFSLLAADTQRKKVIYVGGQGVCRYGIPTDETQMGTWEGPYTFGMSTQEWARIISDGKGLLTRAPWHGFIGTHHSGLNQTNFRYNLSRRWNVIRWND